MAYKVRNEISVSIYINDREYPLNEVNTLNFLHMAAGTKIMLPTVHFSIVDVTNSMSKIGLADGVPINVVISRANLTTTRSFRVHSWVNPPNSQMFNIDGFWDSPRFRIGTAESGIRGTSSSALARIAQECGLNYSGVATNDNQLWTPRNRTFGEFAAYVATHGYRDDKSHLVMCVDSQGTLRYRDARNPRETYDVVHGQSAERAFQCQAYQPEAQSGLNAAFGAYRSTRVVQSVLRDPYELERLSFTPNVKNVQVNSEVRAAQGRGAYAYSPIDFGNVHANAQRARYQNARYDSLLSIGTSFLMTLPTELEPLDGVRFSTGVQQPGAYEGQYVLAHKVIYLQGTTYSEKLLGFKEGLS